MLLTKLSLLVDKVAKWPHYVKEILLDLIQAPKVGIFTLGLEVLLHLCIQLRDLQCLTERFREVLHDALPLKSDKDLLKCLSRKVLITLGGSMSPWPAQ